MKHDLALTALALALVACGDEGSLGTYPDTDSDSDSDAADDGDGADDGGPGGDGADDGATGMATGGDGTTSGDDGTATDATATTMPTSGSGDDDGSTGATGCSEGCTVYEIDCDAFTCGGLSPIDEDGCMRTRCTGDPTACDEDERCYQPMQFGGCESSAGCFDDESTMSCQCGSLPDCGGAFCIPERLYPEGSAGPAGEQRMQDDCQPNDGPAVAIVVGSGVPASCDPLAPPDPDGRLHMVIYGSELELGTHYFGGFASQLGHGYYEVPLDPGFGTVPAAGFVVIDELGDTGASGSYHAVLEDGTHLQGTLDAQDCTTGVFPCG